MKFKYFFQCHSSKEMKKSKFSGVATIFLLDPEDETKETKIVDLPLEAEVKFSSESTID